MLRFDAGKDFREEADFVGGTFGVTQNVLDFFAITPEDSSTNERHAEVPDAEPGKFSAQDVGDEGASGCGTEEGDDAEQGTRNFMESRWSFAPSRECGGAELTLLPRPKDGEIFAQV